MIEGLRIRLNQVAVELNYVLDDDLSDMINDAVVQLCDEFECDDEDDFNICDECANASDEDYDDEEEDEE